jgi:hypothetical protein
MAKENEVSCREPRRSFVLWTQIARTEYLTMRKILAITHITLDSVMQSPGAFQ